MKSDWIVVDVGGTKALEIPMLGCLVRHGAGVGASMVFVPEAAIENGKLVVMPSCSTRITFSSDAQTSTSTTKLSCDPGTLKFTREGEDQWVGDAGEKLEQALAKNPGGPADLTDAINFVQTTWKIVPKTKQLLKLKELLDQV